MIRIALISLATTALLACGADGSDKQRSATELATGSQTAATVTGNQRPLSDWLAGQGTTSVFFPPAPDILGWGNGDDHPIQPPRFALVDYAGVLAAYLRNHGINLGTSVSGTVTEEPLADGTARVHVDVHTTNAFTWVTDDSTSFPGPTLLGNSVADVLAGAAPVLGTCELEVVFINPAGPGAPLPNLVLAIGNLPGLTCQAGNPLCLVEHIRFSATATGPTARLTITETGLDHLVEPPSLRDAFPVESLSLMPLP